MIIIIAAFLFYVISDSQAFAFVMQKTSARIIAKTTKINFI
jgi:hypothetical protein